MAVSARLDQKCHIDVGDQMRIVRFISDYKRQGNSDNHLLCCVPFLNVQHIELGCKSTRAGENHTKYYLHQPITGDLERSMGMWNTTLEADFRSTAQVAINFQIKLPYTKLHIQ